MGDKATSSQSRKGKSKRAASQQEHEKTEALQAMSRSGRDTSWIHTRNTRGILQENNTQSSVHGGEEACSVGCSDPSLCTSGMNNLWLSTSLSPLLYVSVGDLAREQHTELGPWREGSLLCGCSDPSLCASGYEQPLAFYTSLSLSLSPSLCLCGGSSKRTNAQTSVHGGEEACSVGCSDPSVVFIWYRQPPLLTLSFPSLSSSLRVCSPMMSIFGQLLVLMCGPWPLGPSLQAFPTIASDLVPRHSPRRPLPDHFWTSAKSSLLTAHCSCSRKVYFSAHSLRVRNAFD
jgi:hypothetical protein